MNEDVNGEVRNRGRGGEGGGGGEDQACIAFKGPASEFTLHHFCYILSFRYESRHLAHIKGREIRVYF